MTVEEFRLKGKEMIDYMCNYMTSVGSHRVSPDVQPGYLRKLLPTAAPTQAEDWDTIMADVESKIMLGMAHWQHPKFHGYFPISKSVPSLLGDMLSGAFGSVPCSWVASPAGTELETIVLDWFGRAIGLPQEFLAHAPNSKGGGVIQASASECILVCMLAARADAIKRLKENDPDKEDSTFLHQLVAYCSEETHSCVEKNAMICLVKLRILPTDDKGSLRGSTVQQAMEEDEVKGLTPFFVVGTLGTTPTCSFDNLTEIGPITKQNQTVWFHVDGAYGGSAFICPEFKPLMEGMEYADSFNTNPHKWMLVTLDCSTMWVRNRLKLTSALVVDPLYLQHPYSDEAIDYRHWGIPLSRRFRALKLWFVFRRFGIEGIQAHIRNHCRLAKVFEAKVGEDKRFEVVNDVKMGLVCFRLRGTDLLNQKLLASTNGAGQLHMIAAMVRGRYVIRFCVDYEHAKEDDMDESWRVIQTHASDLLEAYRVARTKLKPADLKAKFRSVSNMLSFTRQVTKEVYQRNQKRLYDGATPVIVQEHEDDVLNFDLTSVDEQGMEIGNE